MIVHKLIIYLLVLLPPASPGINFEQKFLLQCN